MIVNLSNYDYEIKKFGAFFYLEKDFNFINSIYDKLNFNHFTRFIILLLLSFLPLIYFFKNLIFIRKKLRFYSFFHCYLFV